jgi:hypothetical protein
MHLYDRYCTVMHDVRRDKIMCNSVVNTTVLKEYAAYNFRAHYYYYY